MFARIFICIYFSTASFDCGRLWPWPWSFKMLGGCTRYFLATSNAGVLYDMMDNPLPLGTDQPMNPNHESASPVFHGNNWGCRSQRSQPVK